jgi:hypothetical protein
MYLSWAAYYEGRTDSAYFNVLIPRLLENILVDEGIRPYDVGTAPSVEFGMNNRAFDSSASEICRRLSEFHILFVHADYGGRALEQTIAQRREALIKAAAFECDFDESVAVLLSPKHELESWAVADGLAVQAAFGVTALPKNLLPASPQQAELLVDPKSLLRNISRYVGRRRDSGSGMLVRIAQEQRFSELRKAASFRDFEESLKAALRHIGCLA